MFSRASSNQIASVSSSVSSLPMSLFALVLSCLLVPVISSSTHAQEIPFRDIVGAPDGEFGWNTFSGHFTDDYAGPHDPDLFTTGTGTANITVTSSGEGAGMITNGGNGNLYSFFSTPTWEFNASDLKQDLLFTSIGIQLVSSGTYDLANVLIGDRSPDEFTTLVTQGEGMTRLYLHWAAWNGLTRSSDYTATFAAPAGTQHISLAAAKFSYFNTDDQNFRITAIPEPTSAVALMLLGAGFALRRRKI